ncbi:hypothetical protein RRU01S_39_00030 [Agrobacterium rubi TR3 = NBRC 13261]|uniref:Uncharacterized protein n=1 Tax=Agrobacterium rubi TR3 = NBRC 13261 TaxID=1368415 RepID=A0A081D3C8_9HYPH|nr:hypothetical protein [Agrobacterium rubi]GAK73424.1 hypothetical protein RRU01S_39_00030 [Agrobacterium rubi TR3 = NBRC 13261]
MPPLRRGFDFLTSATMVSTTALAGFFLLMSQFAAKPSGAWTFDDQTTALYVSCPKNIHAPTVARFLRPPWAL